MKEKRGLSGIYYRFKNEEEGIWENRVFEDLPEAYQDKVMAKYTWVQLANLCKKLANTITNLGEDLDLTTENN